MRRTVGLAKERGVRVGAHPSLPDLQGFARGHAAVDPDAAAARILRAIHDGKVRSVTGNDVPVVVESVCVRSDTPGAVAVAREVHRAIEAYLS
jgi:lactam utilization protein B